MSINSIVTAQLPFSNNRSGNYQTVTHQTQCGMDKTEIRRRRLRQVIDERFQGKTARLAAYLDMKAPQLHRWLSGKQGIHEGSAMSMCQKLNLPDGWLDTLPTDLSDQAIESAEAIGRGNPRKPPFSAQPNTTTPLHDLPILTREDIMDGKFRELHALVGQRASIKVSGGTHSPDSFGFEVADHSMAGGAEPLLAGWIAIVDPAEIPQNEDAVLLGKLGEHPIIRQYLIDGPRRYVQATGLKLDPRELEQEEEIIGVVVGQYYIRQRKR